ncbi:HlyD family secretion protein [Terricaulis sp.]|uniref:HlyD family secretion protein n=1 Tax=Terricaulis sp. TaxID=2768686 RepID=UPI00378429E1
MKRFVFASLLLLAACGKQTSDAMQGYGEADYVYIASQETGVVAELLVREGDRVAAGAQVFRLDPQRLTYGAQSAAAQRSALAEALQAAQADLRLAQTNYTRSEELYRRGFLARARLDADREARNAADARVDQAQRQLAAAGSEAGLASERVSDTQGRAPLAGTIEQIYHRPGEVVPAGQPVAALLAPENMKVRFFAPQALLSRLPVGARVSVRCDGCEQAFEGRVSFVAQEPEFTPPVIYSLDQREKLVFLVEARFDAPTAIRPGAPVDVRIVDSGGDRE